ncbi:MULTISPECIES: phosphatidate cytidylyltransferase [unclassified Virgibacillus]|uniref:phosphatidate cytidylyltransferase n=1 Tax=unclassified Virgibacillus TaxID=2620237 RepID=UPI0024DDFA52|nr:phosphatidate cytidylyltransferase [Virgibacillus sp. LDC-1]
MKQRIITASWALLIFIPILIYGNWPFTVLLYALATIALIEFMRMGKIPLFSFPALLAIAVLWLLLDRNLMTFFTKAEWLMLFVLLILAFTVVIKNKFTFENAGFVILATIYVGMGFYYFLETRADGLAKIFFVLLLVYATDTGAYFVGKALGKHKLWPEISPNKTIEGAIGGIVLAAIVGIVFQLMYPFELSMSAVLGVTVLVSIFGQVGDLVESAFKRHFGVKDSGNILPGHGGILDRFDSLIFVFPMLHFIQFIH